MLEKDSKVMTFQLSEVQESTVWIIVDSLLMEGVATFLVRQDYPGLDYPQDLNRDFVACRDVSDPKLIIFERSSPDSYRFLDMLRERPELHLLAIDGTCDQVIVLKSEKKDTRTMDELLQIINEITRGGG